ncbi:hypothetical protein [Nannocystis bainbridge]|uniref:Enolpyruvate transferase domain-containing protein n=1 Tax=Nannocystis bainbridge TaxID=2995303 RepID=A0ABT5DT74_9BACT|nr:hypothetical protein [Nannocystis bainbridge]MDC0716849.1 hypothetical protein [Nannocystis bainbridge]
MRPLDVATAGTAARFLAALLAASPVACLVDGSARMRERPMEGLLQAQGADIACRGADDTLPCEIRGARLRGGEIRLARPPSSQFISALLLAAALAAAPLRIVLEPGTPARPWVEPDASAATYLWSLAAIYGGEVTVPGLGRASQQGDARFGEVLARMGAAVEHGEHGHLVRGTGSLRGVDLDLADMPDATRGKSPSPPKPLRVELRGVWQRRGFWRGWVRTCSTGRSLADVADVACSWPLGAL